MSESLYFIGIIPPSSIQEEITKLKLEIADKYGSSHSLKSPPHITLHMPFKWKEKKRDQLLQMMNILNDQLEPFTVELKNFDYFEPRVVFVDVQESKPLERLQKNVVNTCRKTLKIDNANYKDRPFHPHITIGFRDLKKSKFYEARSEFETREVSFNFQVECVSLLKHDGSQWNVVKF